MATANVSLTVDIKSGETVQQVMRRLGAELRLYQAILEELRGVRQSWIERGFEETAVTELDALIKKYEALAEGN